MEFTDVWQSFSAIWQIAFKFIGSEHLGFFFSILVMCWSQAEEEEAYGSLEADAC